jgi:hypothetical protein
MVVAMMLLLLVVMVTVRLMPMMTPIISTVITL